MSDVADRHKPMRRAAAEATELARRKSLLARMAGNIAAGLVSSKRTPDYTEIAMRAVTIAECILEEIEERHPSPA